MSLNQPHLAGAVAVLPRLPQDAIQSNRKLHLKALTERQKKAGLQHPDRVYPNMIPEPDYSDGEDDGRHHSSRDEEDGLIVPKKLPNPCLESVERKKLHQELMFNQKHGKNVLNQKSELQRAMEKHRDQQARKEMEQQKQSTLTPFQRVLEERAKKLETVDKEDDEKAAEEPENEFLKVHAKVRARLDSK